MPPTGVGVTTAVIVGAVSSRLTVSQAWDEELPCVSTAWPQIDWLAPCVVTWTGEGQVAIGYEPAVQVNVTVTVELFQPLLLGLGEAAALVVGRTTGWMLRVTLVEAELPALSVAVPLTGVEPMVEIVTGEAQLATPDNASEQANVTVAVP
jgi:hypothetical protein